MVDEDSHSTDLSVSGEEGHSFSNARYAAKVHKNA